MGKKMKQEEGGLGDRRESFAILNKMKLVVLNKMTYEKDLKKEIRN